MSTTTKQYQDLIDSCDKLIDYIIDGESESRRFTTGAALDSLRSLRNQIEDEMFSQP